MNFEKTCNVKSAGDNIASYIKCKIGGIYKYFQTGICYGNEYM